MKKGTKKRRSKKQKKNVILILVISFGMLLAFSAFVGVTKESVSVMEEKKEEVFPDYDKIVVKEPSIMEKLLTKNKNSRPEIPLSEIKGIVIHYTANPGTDAKANRNYFESRKDEPDQSANKVSSHYIIGLSGNIIRCVPDTEIAYASNSRNSDTLSIECCHPDASGKFSAKTYQSLIHLVAYLADKYRISMDEIIRHYDVTGKECPKYYVLHEDQWIKLKEDIKKYLRDCTKSIK